MTALIKGIDMSLRASALISHNASKPYPVAMNIV